jgi:hypothetical protein
VPTEEIHTGSDGPQSSLHSIPEEVPATSAEEMEAKAAADTATKIPQPMPLEVVHQEAVKTSTVNLHPKPQDPHTKKQKFKADDFFTEHQFFTDYNPYDSSRLHRKCFRTVSQMNYYSSLLFDKDKVFAHEQIPHVDMESLPCFTLALSVLHDAGLLNFCTDICDWNEELILQFYATLHITENVEDVNSWVLDWMTDNTHFKAPASELLHVVPVSPPTEGARLIYEEPELSNYLMQVLMKPLKAGQAPRTTFLVKKLLYVPRTIYRILTKTLSPMKGHNSDEEEVVGIMKNLLFNMIHGIPINYHDFFMRTLANAALSPFELKPYAPWIMKFIRSRSSIHYQADFQNHLSYLPPIEVLKWAISSADEKGKATVIDEGTRPLDGQFHKAASYSTNDDSETQDSVAKASKQNPQATAPRVMTDHELLLGLHQKVDRNHK